MPLVANKSWWRFQQKHIKNESIAPVGKSLIYPMRNTIRILILLYHGHKIGVKF